MFQDDLRHAIAAMGEPSLDVTTRNRTQGIHQGVQQCIQGACFGRAQCLLDFRPAQLDRVEEFWQERRLSDTEIQQAAEIFGKVKAKIAAETQPKKK